MNMAANGSATHETSGGQVSSNFEPVLRQFLRNVLKNGSKSQRTLCEDLLFALNNHQSPLYRLDVRGLRRTSALDKLTKRFIELILENQNKLVIVVSDIRNSTEVDGTSHERSDALRREILAFLRQQLKSCTQIFNDGQLDGQILVHLYNAPRMLASLSRHSIPIQQTGKQSDVPSLILESHDPDLTPSPPSSTTDRPQPVFPAFSDHEQNSLFNGSDDTNDDPPNLIDWSIDKQTGDWLVNLRSDAPATVANMQTFIALLAPFVLGTAGGHCNRLIIAVDSNNETSVQDSTFGKHLYGWLNSNMQLAFELDSPRRGTVTVSIGFLSFSEGIDKLFPFSVHNLIDSLRYTQRPFSAGNVAYQRRSACLEQLLTILNVDGFTFDLDDMERRAKSAENLFHHLELPNSDHRNGHPVSGGQQTDKSIRSNSVDVDRFILRDDDKKMTCHQNDMLTVNKSTSTLSVEKDDLNPSIRLHKSTSVHHFTDDQSSQTILDDRHTCCAKCRRDRSRPPDDCELRDSVTKFLIAISVAAASVAMLVGFCQKFVQR